MTAEVLREAAALMRERAEAARAGRWGRTESTPGGTLVVADRAAGPVRVASCTGSLPEGNEANATHIASWHPAVALAVADWLEDIAERHKPDPEPADLTLHYEQECPTGECEDPGYHEGCIVCWGCYPSHDGMDGRTLYPCAETKAALAVANTYLGRTP
jgi:hypothetical protein